MYLTELIISLEIASCPFTSCLTNDCLVKYQGQGGIIQDSHVDHEARKEECGMLIFIL